MERKIDLVNTVMGAVCNEVQGHGGGKTFPGADYPFGMVQLSPDTVTGADNGCGYSYGHETLEGFSFLHLSGIGWYGDLGNLQVMPYTGGEKYRSGSNAHSRTTMGEPWKSHYSHETEVTRPGYYAVSLTDYDIRVEATAARHLGILRMTFPRTRDAHVALDLARRIGGRATEEFITLAEDGKTISGYVHCTPEGGGFGHGHGNIRYKLHFYGEFSRPCTGFTLWDGDRVVGSRSHYTGEDVGFIAHFDTTDAPVVELALAISFVDAAGAENNFKTEFAPFEAVRSETENAWEEMLSGIQVEGDRRDMGLFYSCLYRTAIDPRDFSDCDGRYRAAMGEVKTIGDFVFRTVFSGWDVFRSQFPLLTLMRPDVVRDEIRSLMEIAPEVGRFPRWELLGIEAGCMVGDPGTNIICDAYLKGIRDFDPEKALEYMLAYPAKAFMEQGFFPNDVSVNLEYAYTAWCVSRYAEALGKTEIAETYRNAAQNYRNIFDASAGWFNLKDENGIFLPFEGKYSEKGCVESNIYQQTWFVPHDIPGLRQLMTPERFDRELEEFFEKSDFSAFWNEDYNHSNEPVHTVPHIFVHTGKPHRTQYWVRRIQKEAYRPGPYGYCGNEDVGQMSAWYVLTAMGIHQSVPGSNVFELNTPLFSKIRLQLNRSYHSCSAAESLEILTDRDPQTHGYIRGVALNGKALDRTWLTWEELTGGGTLELSLSADPTAFGAEKPPLPV